MLSENSVESAANVVGKEDNEDDQFYTDQVTVCQRAMKEQVVQRSFAVHVKTGLLTWSTKEKILEADRTLGAKTPVGGSVPS